MADLFLSYSREDKPRAQQLAAALEARGWSVWWDRQILAGQNFNAVIVEQLDIARCIIVLWSTHSLKSKWVLDEAGEGAKNDRLIPCLVENNIEPPMGFRQIQTTNLTDWLNDSSDEEFDRFVDSIAALAPPSKRKRRGKRDEPAATDRHEGVSDASTMRRDELLATPVPLQARPPRPDLFDRQINSGRHAIIVIPCTIGICTFVYIAASSYTNSQVLVFAATGIAFIATISAFLAMFGE